MKKIIKGISGILIAVIACFGVFSSTSLFASKTFAGSPVSYLDSHKSSQSTAIVIDKAVDNGNGEFVYYLYPNGNNISSIKDAFSYYVSNATAAGNDSNSQELVHHKNSSSQSAHNNGQFVSLLSLSNNMIIAMNEGYVSLNASAYFTSGKGIWASISKDKYDKPESVEMALYAYNDSANVKKNVSGERENYLGSADVLSFDSSELKSNNFDKIELAFTSSYVTSRGVYTTANYMKVKQPMVAVSTTDVTKPSLSVSGESDWTNENRNLTISVSDADSGLHKIQVSTDGENWEDIFVFDSYQTSATNFYELEENGTYYFKAFDNVGNVSDVFTYTESNIDKVVPEIKIEIGDLFTEKSFSFNAELSGLGISADNFYFTYEESGITSENIQLVNGINNITVAENGTYTFDFYGEDEAGNVCHISKENIVVDDTLYNLNLVSHNSSANLEGGNVSAVKRGTYKFSFVANQNSVFSKIKITTGETSYELSENEINFVDDAKSSGEFQLFVSSDVIVEIFYKQIVELNIQTEYTYNADGFKVNYTANANIDENLINFEYYDLNDNLIENAVNLDFGEYYVRYNIVENDLYLGYGRAVITVYKKELLITLNKTQYEYSGSIQTLDLTLSEDVDISVEIQRNGDKADFDIIGEYSYIVYCLNDNYYLAGNISGNVSMLKHNIVVTVEESNFTYNAESHILNFTIDTALVNIDDIVVEYYLKSDYENGNLVQTIPVNAGEYVAVFTFDNENFSLDKVVDITVAKKKVSVYAKPVTITYGDETPNFEYYYTGNVEGEELTFEVLTNLSVNSLGLVNAGSYEILFKDVEFENYEVELYKSEMFVVNKKPVTIIPHEASKQYGQVDPTFEFSAIGLVDGDSFEGALSRYDNENQKVGFYNITLGTLRNSNYDISLDIVLFEIQKRPAIIILKNASKIYGEANPSFEFYIDGSNVLAEDVDEILNAIECENVNGIGKYNISVNLEKVKNYNIVSVNSTLTVVPAKLQIVANNASKVYGETDVSLTYNVYGLVDGDEISGNLSRESGEDVGEYKITLGSINQSNYDIEFVSATFTITPATLLVSANSVSKIYGENDCDLTYEVVGLVDDDEISGKLLREVGENVGEYLITLGSLSCKNYVIEYTPSYFEIQKAQITITFDNSLKTYGEENPSFNYTVSGLLEADSNLFTFEAFCDAKIDSNVGLYDISARNIVINSSNYNQEVIVNVGVLEIEKADINAVLANKTAVYTGNSITIDEIDFDLDFVYVYSNILGTVESAVNAGEYNVYAKFDGNENYNAFTSNTAILTISKKIVPIMVKQSVFIYTGNQQSPVYEIGLDESISLIVRYENDVYPVEIGSYSYTIESNDPNYYCNFKGVVKVVSEFYTENGNGDASMTTDNVNYSSSDIEIYEDASLLSTFSSFNDGLKCVTAYGFKNIGNNYHAGDVFTFKIKAIKTNESVKIYTLDRTGKITEIAYTVDDGYYVLSINDLSVSILVTNTDTTMLYAKIGSIAAILILCVIITKSINRYRRNRFFKKNTVYKKLDSKLNKESLDIVNSRLSSAKKISGSEFIGKK